MQGQNARSRQPNGINSSLEYYPSADSEQIMNANAHDDLLVRAQYDTSRRMRIANVNMNANALRPPKHKTSSVPYRSKNTAPDQPSDSFMTPNDFKASMDEMGIARPLIGQG